jgi:UDP-N-acetylmuramoylalanine--D-glutamate ligase
MQVLDLPGAGRVVDDSKSTCLAATAAALQSEGKGVHLIAGGLGKGEDPGRVRALLSDLDVSVYLIGQSAEGFAASWRGHAPHCEVCGTLERAVGRAWSRRHPSQPLLFSPGCASFDQFIGYAQRGDHFQQLVTGQAEKNPLNEPHAP